MHHCKADWLTSWYHCTCEGSMCTTALHSVDDLVCRIILSKSTDKNMVRISEKLIHASLTFRFWLKFDSGTSSHSDNTRQRSNRKLKDSYLTFSPEFPVSSESWACELQSFLPCYSHRWQYGFWSNSFQIGFEALSQNLILCSCLFNKHWTPSLWPPAIFPRTDLRWKLVLRPLSCFWIYSV